MSLLEKFERYPLTFGGVQANHTRMVAATAAKIGIKCVVIQEKWVPHYDAVYDRVGNILMTHLSASPSKRRGRSKSMQGLIDLTKKGFFPDAPKVLYAHLGGAPVLNGYSYYYRNG